MPSLPNPNGQGELKPKEDNLTLKQLTNVFGDSGTERYAGFIMEEINPKWRDEQRVDIVEEMRRSDGTVKALLNAIKAPILAAEWNVECDDEEIKEFVSDCLFNMQRSWKDFLREALGYLDFGHYCFEIIYKIEDGRAMIADLAPRIPHSILKWQLSDGSFGITQSVRTDEVTLVNAEIPGEKLLIFTNDKEGDDVTGQSILRPTYKHYKMKDVLYRIQGIAAERYGVGVPIVTLPEGHGEDEKTEAEDLAGSLRSNEKGFVVMPEGWKIEILVPTGNPQGQAIDLGISHHDKMILRAGLASFLGLGTDGTGSFALSKDMSSFFLKVVEDKSHYLCEQIEKQVLRRLVRMNFGEDAAEVRLKHTPLGDIDYKELSEVLSTLITAGLVQPDAGMQTYVRKAFQLPELTEEEIAAIGDVDSQIEEIEKEIDDEEEMPEPEMDEESPTKEKYVQPKKDK